RRARDGSTAPRNALRREQCGLFRSGTRSHPAGQQAGFLKGVSDRTATSSRTDHAGQLHLEGVPMLKLTRLCLVALLSYGWLTNVIYGAPVASADLSVRETAGIRRNNYPVNVLVPVAKGTLKDPSQVRLLSNNNEVAAQVAVESSWQDNSIRSLDLNFNVSIGPLERQAYRVEFGNDVKSAATANGLSVTQTADAFSVGRVRFGKAAS